MTMAGTLRMGRSSHTRPRERLRAFLERDYRGRPGALAHEVDISPKAAENLLNGHWPGDVTLAAIIRRFGEDVWQIVFRPEIEPVIARLTEEERRLERALEEARSRRRQVEGLPPGLPAVVDALEDPRSARRSPVETGDGDSMGR